MLMETKEMFLKLPMVEINDWSEIGMKETYPGAGRYIVRHANGDTQVADIISWPDEGETVGYSATCVGSDKLYDPDEWTLKIDLENQRNAFEKKKERYEAELAHLRCALEDFKQRYDKDMADKEKECAATIENELAVRRAELEHEYELKKTRQELETPKRSGQCEWVSGKTLTEIIKVIVNGKEDRV